MITNLLKLITAPSKHIQSREDIQRASLLSGMVFTFFCLIVTLGINIFFFAERAPGGQDYKQQIVILGCSYFGIYFLSRTRYHRIAAYIFVTLVSVSVALMASQDKNTGNVIYLLSYLIISVFVASVVMNDNETLTFSFIAFLIIATYPFYTQTDAIPNSMVASVGVLVMSAALLASISAKMQRSFIKSAELSELNALEQKAIATANFLRVKTMLSSLNQGILTIDSSLRVQPEYSAHLPNIIEQNEIAGKSIIDLFFSHTGLNQENLDMIRTVFSYILGADPINIEVNKHILPEKLVFSSGKPKHLEISYDPIVDDNIVKEMLIVIKDVTERLEQEEALNERNAELARLTNILSLTNTKFQGYISHCDEMLSECKEIIAKNDLLKENEMTKIMRLLHTMKGNARTLKFDDTSATIHEVEDEINKIRLMTESGVLSSSIQEHFLNVEKSVKSYQTTYESFLRTYVDKQSDFDRSKKTIELASTAIWLERNNEQNKLKDAIAKLDIYFTEACSIDFSKNLEGLVRDLPDLAGMVGKPCPKVTIKGDGVRIPLDLAPTIQDCFMHIFRNCLDHGIETPDVRRRQGKPESGAITIAVKEDETSISMLITDDGGGLDIRRIKEKAEKNGIDTSKLKAKDILDLIFRDNFSTKEVLSQISGRGVGMNVVKGFIEENGGHVELEAKEGEFDIYPFQLRINIPSLKTFLTKAA